MTVRRISVQVRLELRSVSYVIQMRDLLAIDKLFNFFTKLAFSILFLVCYSYSMSQKTGPLQLISPNFTNSQHSLIEFPID